MTAQKIPLSLPPPYRFLEAVRGMAALWVVAFHATKLITAIDPGIATNLLVQPFYRGNLGVQVFFVVSGYCIANAACSSLFKPRPLGSYFFARLRRIFPPCWASLVFFALAAVTASWLQRQGQIADTSLVRLDLAHQPFKFYFANLTLTQILLHQPFLSIVCWTLCYEVAFYLIVAVPLFIVTTFHIPGSSPQSKIRPMLTVLHCLTFACCGFLLFAPHLLPYPFDLWTQFGLGIALFDAVASPRTFPRLVLLVFFALLAVFLFSQNILIGYTQEESRWTYATALVAAIILYTFHRLDLRLMQLAPVRFAAFVGHFSYSLYLINFLAVSGLMILVRRLSLSTSAHVAVVYIITLLILIPAYGFFYLFERPFLGRRSTSRVVKGAPLTTADPPAEIRIPAPVVLTAAPVNTAVSSPQT